MKFSKCLIMFTLLAVGGSLWPVWAQAGETREEQLILGDNTDRIFIQGIRPMAMGGAQIAIADDENALFYNPAGLARLNYWRFTLPHWLVGTDTHSFDQTAFWLKNYGEFGKFPDVSPEVGQALQSTRIHWLAEVSTKYIGPNFGLGIYLTPDVLLKTHAILIPEAEWTIKGSAIENLSFAYGGDIPMFGYLSGGIALKAVQRGVSQETKNALELASLDMQPAMEWGAGFDLGLMYQPTSEITVALVAADLYTRILEEVQVPNLKIGFAYKPYWLNFPDLSTTLALDVVELNWQGDNEFKNSPQNAALLNLSKVRTGLEFVLAGLVALRGGLYQGYPTAGVSLLTSFISLEWAYFGRELGTYPGQHPEWNHRISVDWHTGGPVNTPTPTPTSTPTPTPSPEPTFTSTPTPLATSTPKPTPQPTLTGNIPKLHGTFVGFTGTITLVPRLPEDTSDVTAWNLVITNPKGVPVKRLAGQGQPPKSLVWNGKDTRGERVSSKLQYPFVLTLTTAGGDKTLPGTLFIVDTIPKLYTSKSFELYPDKVYFSIKDPIKGAASWKLDIFNDANEVIRSYVTNQEELFKAFAWDSKDDNGTAVANNAAYRYELSVVDAAGNQIVISDRIRPVLAEIYVSDNRTTIKIGDILFDTGKAFLTAEMFDKVIKCAYVMQDEPASETVINGHTDSTGSVKTNMKLSLVRAESVRRFLVDEQNVPEYQMTIQGWGSQKPVASNKTADGRKKNRRDEVIIRLPR